MCGIAGKFHFRDRQPVPPELIARMNAVQAHRGPDGAGTYFDRGLGLGHRRLSIIDVAGGHQPLANEDETVVVVFNGEIYNFAAVRAELETHGHRFRSRSDTEVIVHGYEQWGTDCVTRFNGMFAFAVYDTRRRELFLARDRLGIKPLYYWAEPGRFCFASEIKAFAALPGFVAALNESAVAEYLLYRSLAGDATLFQHVHALPPGHWLRVRSDLTTERRAYWDITAHERELSEPLAEPVLALLQESVQLQEISDVPIGAQLSGGTDSSLVTALMAARARQPVKTFSVGFAEPGYSELPYARIVAEQFHTDHHEIVRRREEFAAALEKLTWHLDEPLTHPNSAGIYWLCQCARQHVTVLLTGEGADETFAGYYRYVWLTKCFAVQRWFPAAAKQWRWGGRHRALRSIQKALNQSPAELTVTSSAQGWDYFRPHLGPTACRDALATRLAVFDAAPHPHPLNRALYYDLKTYLPPILMRQDRMSMAHSLETRVPFLDHRLVELAFRLPPRAKVHRRRGKWLLKQIARRFLPDALLDRPKIGFGFPLAPWMRQTDGLGEQLDLLLAPHSLTSRLVPRTTVAEWLTAHRRGTVDYSDPLWTLLALEIWYRGLRAL